MISPWFALAIWDQLDARTLTGLALVMPLGLLGGIFAMNLLRGFRFILPYAQLLFRDGMMESYGPVRRAQLSALLQAFWLAAFSMVVSATFSWCLIWYFGAMAVVVGFGWRRTGKTPANIERFLRRNVGLISPKLWRILAGKNVAQNLRHLALLALDAEAKATRQVAVLRVEEAVLAESAKYGGAHWRN